jgi:transposase
MPIDKVTGKRRETTTEERISVIEKNAEGKSYLEIAEIAGVLRSRVAGIVKEWQQHNIEDTNRSGRPSKLSDSDVHYLKMFSDRNPSAPFAEIVGILSLANRLGLCAWICIGNILDTEWGQNLLCIPYI